MRREWKRIREALGNWSERLNRPPVRRLGLVLGASALVLLTTLIVSRFPLQRVPHYALGEMVRADIITPVELIVIDHERTERLRAEEAKRVPPVFRYFPDRAREARSLLAEYFTATRSQLLAQLEATFQHPTLSREERSRFRHRLRALIAELRLKGTPFPLTDEVVERWVRGDSGEDVLRRLDEALDTVMKRYIRSDDPLPELVENLSGNVTVVPASVERAETFLPSQTVRASDLLPLGEARRAVARVLSEADERQYGHLLRSLVRVNCVLADDLTARARREATEHIVATRRYAPRQVIAQRGETVTPTVQEALDALRRHFASERSGRRLAGLMIIVAALYYALWRFAERVRVYYLTSVKIFLLAALTVVLQALINRIGMAVASGVAYRFGDYDSPEAYQYAIPYATAALVVALLLESRIALTVGVLSAILVGLMTGSLGLLAYALLGSMAAIYGVGRYERRATITRAGWIIGVANMIVTLVPPLMEARPIVFGPALFSALCGAGGGLLTATLAAFALPPTESLFGIVTDVKLLELSNVELPLLKRLALEAPGTYQHSLIVATLAEAAAKAVGANALLVRIGSYYHDIGKLNDPRMYVENQRPGMNPHDLLSPEESVERIVRHVQEGIRMAEEAHLPRQIIDLIPQHHGTRRLHYFYNKALHRAETTGQVVDEQRFRYPGPKPQTIEAAIVMMCDSAEAAARSLRQRTPENIRRIVRKIIDDIVTDGQLDECNLRMRDLRIIRQTILQTLLTIYHERVPYPGFTEEDLARIEVSYEALPEIETISQPPLPPDFDPTIDESWPPPATRRSGRT
ncbi:MAG TPA: HDIG domain-containing protein [Blastocatellia bacterium]|nr:HDIG domain-containing protein [Blastocatellia bacterium]